MAAAALLATACNGAAFGWRTGAPAAPGSSAHSSPDGAGPRASQAQNDGARDGEAPPTPFETADRQRITQVDPWVSAAARRHTIDPNLIHAVIWVESRHQPRAKSPAGARGLMQLMPATAHAMAREMGETRPKIFDPEFNVNAGSLYLAKLLDRYDGDEVVALAAYNAGPGNVGKWLDEDGELPPRSLQYVTLVMDAKRRFDARLPAEATPPAEHRTMLARTEEPEPQVVPEPPPSAAEVEMAQMQENNPWAPEPGVYKPTYEPEPPLMDTPWPPIDDDDDDDAPVAASAGDAVDGNDGVESPPESPAEVEPQGDASPAVARGLPGVLD